jgi:HK97 family phage portal protein
LNSICNFIACKHINALIAWLTFKARVPVFNLITKKKAISALTPLLNAVQQLQYRVNTNTSAITVYGYANQTAQVGAYANTDDLYAIVNKVMKTAALIPIYEYNIVNNKAYSRFRIMQRKCVRHPTNQNISDLKELQVKALELAGEDSELQYFLDHPNRFQSKNEFYQLTYLFKLLAGNYYIFKEMMDAGANDGKPYEMYNLPPNWTYPLSSEEIIPRRAVGYRFMMYNYSQTYPLEQVIHGKYANPVFDYVGNELIGLSPLQAGAKTLTTIENEADYQNQALKNAGAGGAIVNEDPTGFTPEALGQMKDDVLRELGSNWQGGQNVNANKLAFLAGKWNYLKLFIDPGNMQLLDQAKLTFKKLCNLYGVSDKLFNNDEGSKYDNYNIALKELYTNAALPLVSALVDDFNNPYSGLITNFGGKSVVGYDISDIPELQENMTDVVARFAQAPAFRVNDFYEAMGYGRIDEINGDKILIKQGYQLLDDVALPEVPLMPDYAPGP